jgi:hypothetical protein
MVYLMKIEGNLIQIFYIISIISIISSALFLPLDQLSFAQKDDGDKDEEEDKLIVEANINLDNIDIENTKFIQLLVLLMVKKPNKIFLSLQ